MSRNEAVKLLPDLRLTLGPSSRREIPRLSLGVGANAAAREEMKFVANDPLCELVWSRRKGLILRYAVPSVPEKKNPLTSAAGPGNMIHSSLPAVETENSHDKLAEERIFLPPPTASKDGAAKSGAESDSGLEDGRMQNLSVESSDHTRPLPGEFPDAFGSSGRGENSKQAHPQSPVKGSSLHDITDLRKPTDDPVPQESSSQCKGLNQSNTLQKEDGENNMPTPSSTSVLPVNKSECIAENDLHGVRLEVYEISKASPIRAVAASEGKGKEKALSGSQEDGDSYKRSSESCNSAGVYVTNKRVRFEEQLFVGSKRLKMQIQEAHTRTNSSFANWISAMIIRPDPSNRGQRELTTSEQDIKFANMGFQTLFESLYRPNPKPQDETLLTSENHRTSKEGKLTVISNPGDVMAVEHNLVSNESLNQPAQEGASQDPFDCKTDAPSKSVSFTPESEYKLVDIDGFKVSKDMESQAHSSEEPSGSSCKKLHNFPLDVEARTTEVQGSKNSEPMVSLLAKRLDALKQIMPMDYAETTATCFFCGITGHDLRCCPELTETEVDELLRNISAYGGREESPCLCIRCFQLNHWAVSCPNVPSRKKHHNKDDEFVSSAVSNEERFERNFSKMKVSSTLIRKSSYNLQKNDDPSCKEFASTLPGPCRSLSRNGLDVTTGIFEAVKSLRLSRTDIIKWMNSMFCAALEGYYLRLRVGKSGQGPGGAAYQVACLCGSQGENFAETSKRPISVIVGGIKCSVETQYISNQDFLEDELKAWWSATLRDDGKIPSEDELQSKVEERRRLGL